MKKFRVFAMIPARSGSKGVPHKNLSVVGNHTLLKHAVTFAGKISVDRIVVSTDSDQYWESVEDALPIPHQEFVRHSRSAFASSDEAREEDILQDYVEQGFGTPDIWVWLKPTSPFRSVEDVERGLKVISESSSIDSVRLVSESDCRVQTIGNLGFLCWYGFPSSLGVSKMPRYSVPNVYSPFNLEIFRHTGWERCPPLFMGDRIHPIICHKITGLDVNDAQDIDIVDGIMNITPRPEWLKPYVHL